MHETKIHDINALRKRLMQTWFDFDQDIIDTAIDQWRDCLRLCVCAGGGPLKTCSEMNVHLCDSTEHFYETINVT